MGCKKIIAGDLVVFSSDEQLSPAAEQDRIQLGKKLDLKSVIAVPLHIDGEVKYALSVGNVKRHTNIQKEIAPRLQLVGEIFINALLRCKNMEQIQKKDIKLKAAYKKISKISEKLALENRYFQNEINASFQSSQMIGISGGLKYIFYRISQVAPSDTTVLLEGETGTGKELIARALHELSKRNKRPLIKLDCTTLHDSMIVSELFGHEKGAFTGAINEHIGRLEVADGSTLFLDEIGEIPLALQAKLLRVIEYGEFERLGSTKTRKVNIRIIAATNRNLSEAVEQGKFRQDLFYRLSVFPLSVPPLRERKEDIPLLANFFIQHFNKQMGKQVEEIPKNILKALQGYSWQGNVRELKNVIERAMITTEGSVLKLADIIADQSHETVSPTNGESLKEVERKHILKVLQETYWRIEGKAGAALKLGLHPDTLRSRMKKLGIKRPSLDK